MSPDDYAAGLGRLDFAPGEVKSIVHVTVRGDTAIEPDETFSVALSEPRTRRSAMPRRR